PGSPHERHGEIVGAFQSGQVYYRVVDIARRRGADLLRELRHGCVLACKSSRAVGSARFARGARRRVPSLSLSFPTVSAYTATGCCSLWTFSRKRSASSDCSITRSVSADAVG